MYGFRIYGYTNIFNYIMSKFRDIKENFDLAFYKTFHTSVFQPPHHLLLIDKVQEKLTNSAEQPIQSSEYYIAKIKGSKIKFVKKDPNNKDLDDSDEGSTGGSGQVGEGKNEEEQEYVTDKSKEANDDPEKDKKPELDRIIDMLKERKDNNKYTDFVVFDHHVKQIQHIKENLRKIENIPLNETDPLYLRLAEAICGSLAEINITHIDNNHDAYITGVLEFLDVVTSTNNRQTLIEQNKDRFPSLCKEAEKAIPNGFQIDSENKTNKPDM